MGGSRKVQPQNKEFDWQKLLLRLGLLGVAFASVHLFLFTLIKLTLFATRTWMWEPIHMLHNYGEVWLGFAGLWLLVYVLACLIILAYFRPGNPEPKTALTRYEVRENGKTLSISIDDIHWISAAGNYVELHTARGVTMVRKTLAQIAAELSGGPFVKSHRSALINGRHVTAIKAKEDSSGYVVQLSNGEEAPLSRRQLSKFKEILKTIT